MTDNVRTDYVLDPRKEGARRRCYCHGSLMTSRAEKHNVFSKHWQGHLLSGWENGVFLLFFLSVRWVGWPFEFIGLFMFFLSFTYIFCSWLLAGCKYQEYVPWKSNTSSNFE